MNGVKAAGSRLLAMFMAVCLAATMAVGVTSIAMPQEAQAAPNQAVTDQRAGVFKFNWGIDGREYARGSAFLINEDTIVTAYHCVMPSSTELAYFGLTPQDVLDRSTYTVAVPGGFQVSATLEKPSEEQDMAILKLDQKLNNVKALTFRNSADVDASEQVYALGFPASADQNAIITFTSNDVAIFDGTVTKPEAQMAYTDNTLANRSGSFLITTCRMDGGTSGGPMVDTDGNVVGVCVAGGGGYFYASASDVLMQALDTMAYSYNTATSSTAAKSGSSSSSSSSSSEKANKLSFTALKSAISKAEGLNSSEYDQASYQKVTDALAIAKEALNIELDDPTDNDEYKEAQGEIDDATSALEAAISGLQKAPEGPNMALIIGIIVAVVVVAAVIIIVLVMRKRNKQKQEEAPTVPLGSTSAAPAAQPALNAGGAQAWQSTTPAVAGGEATETTILDDESPDTVILFQAASGGSLTRMSTNEQIPINSAEFTIGRERSKVDYCLEGNSSISRVHVRIVVRDGKAYLVDNRAANGTYLNGIKCRPGEENLLKGGDIITLADEKFKYNA